MSLSRRERCDYSTALAVTESRCKMNGARRLALSAAFLTLICFLLPWIRLDASGTRDAASGLDLARRGDSLLWLIPALSLTVLALGLVRYVWERLSLLFALSGTAGGCIIAYVMYLERASAMKSAVLPIESTVWYWLGLVASLVIVAAAFVFYARRIRSKQGREQ